MAILKAVGGGKSLYGIIRYITREDKTSAHLIGGWNVDPENAYDEMTATKRQWGKTDGRAYKHFVQSFHADDGITPEEAHAIAAEFVERASLFRDYEVLYATHIDRGHVHTHVVVNSVNIRTGKKFRYAKPALEDLKRLSDEIVQAHGYRLEHERPEAENVTAWDQDLYRTVNDAQQGRRSSWMYETAVAVRESMERSENLNGFLWEMERRGYSVRWGKRSITYTTPDGHRVRASRLEEVFKLPSVREKYAERENEQMQLREDLHRRSQRRSNPEWPSQSEARPAVDYAAFDVDLGDVSEHVFTEEEISSFLYEAACAVCRQLRTARSADEFYRSMRQGGFRVQYDKAMRDYIIHTSDGSEISAKFLEQFYGLPSIRDAVIQLHRRPNRARPVWDGRIWPEYAEGSRDTDWDDLLRDNFEGRAGYRYGFDSFRRDGRSTGSCCTRMHLYIYPNSPMWDYEIQAAALILGQGACNPDELGDLLRESGYALRTDRWATYLLTPRGRRIVIDDNPPQPIPYKGPFRRGIIAVVAGEVLRDMWLRPIPKQKQDDDIAALVDLTLTAVLGAAVLIEFVARLVGHGIHVLRRKHSEKAIYTIATEKASMTLEDAFERAGVNPEFAARVPAPEEDDFQKDSQNPSMDEKADTMAASAAQRDDDRLEELLGIVQRASIATDRETFIEILAEQGCSTRWTANGTLTFILADGKRIRSSRLEKKFNLPSITAAYGQERRIPTRGARYEAACLMGRVMAPGCSRHAFEMVLTAEGYRVEWSPGGSDATITSPEGQRMRLSSLARTFRLDAVSEMLGDNQRAKAQVQSAMRVEGQRKSLMERIAAAQEELRQGQHEHSGYRRTGFER